MKIKYTPLGLRKDIELFVLNVVAEQLAFHANVEHHDPGFTWDRFPGFCHSLVSEIMEDHIDRMDSAYKKEARHLASQFALDYSNRLLNTMRS